MQKKDLLKILRSRFRVMMDAGFRPEVVGAPHAPHGGAASVFFHGDLKRLSGDHHWITIEIVDLSIWVNYNDLTTTSLEIIVSKGNHPQMALIQVSELL